MLSLCKVLVYFHSQKGGAKRILKEVLKRGEIILLFNLLEKNNTDKIEIINELTNINNKLDKEIHN